MSPLNPTGKLRFTGAVIHKGRTFERGDMVPEDAEKQGFDLERLKRLELVAPARSVDHDE